MSGKWTAGRRRMHLINDLLENKNSEENS